MAPVSMWNIGLHCIVVHTIAGVPDGSSREEMQALSGQSSCHHASTYAYAGAAWGTVQCIVTPEASPAAGFADHQVMPLRPSHLKLLQQACQQAEDGQAFLACWLLLICVGQC